MSPVSAVRNSYGGAVPQIPSRDGSKKRRYGFHPYASCLQEVRRQKAPLVWLFCARLCGARLYYGVLIKSWWAFPLLLLWLAAAPSAFAAGARFITGQDMWVNAGQSEAWATTQLLYSTDAGALGAQVTHAQADAMVAAAAAVWNVPTSSLTLAQGGELAEHVSSANTYLSSTGVVFPTDVQVANEAAIPVAVIYDADGSVTDMLLGAGASNPVACRQNAVTESVDDIQLDGNIHHALILLNGRCVGSAPEQLTQMQYQLTRAFGRVLGLAWSQTNDNVFTAASTVTMDQETYWPLMHPLDVLCGPYSFQCMQNPFTLRADDLSALSMLYSVNPGNLTAGKQLSSTNAVFSWGRLTFPTGQGMDWVNVTAHRLHAGVLESWELVSATTGASYQQALANPVKDGEIANAGTPSGWNEGFYLFQAVPYDGVSNIFFTTEPINPLYTGAYALAPYVRPPATPSGSPQTVTDYSAIGTNFVNLTVMAGDVASACSPGNDGAEDAPAAFDPSGWQTGLLCGWGHNSWWSAAVRAGRSWTLEVTATDETGAPTGNKAQPVLGVWKAGDTLGTPPTVAAQSAPFNSMVFGMTQMRVAAETEDAAVRFVVGDQFGAGRPDFTYRARLLYADVVSPTTMGEGGGVVTILGTGFQAGNVVKVNGVAAVVQSLSPTQIVVFVPSRAAAGAPLGHAVAVAVTDLATGGSTSIAAGLAYTSGADLLREVSAPASLEAGKTSGTPFAVEVLTADGVTALPGATVSLSVSAGTAQLTLCGTAPSCWVTSDSQGLVQSTVTGVAAGAVVLTATEISGGASVVATLQEVNPLRTVALSSTSAYVAAGGAGGPWALRLSATEDGAIAAGVPVVWTAGPGLTLTDPVGSTGSDGTVGVTVSASALPSGATPTLIGCVWGNVCATWTLYSVNPAQWQVSLVSGVGQSVVQGAGLGPVGVEVTDAAGHPLDGASLTVYQRVLEWEGLCLGAGGCPAAPVLAISQATTSTDASGAVVVNPMQIAGEPQTLQIALSWGTQGFLTCLLITTPTPAAGN